MNEEVTSTSMLSSTYAENTTKTCFTQSPMESINILDEELQCSKDELKKKDTEIKNLQNELTKTRNKLQQSNRKMNNNQQRRSLCYNDINKATKAFFRNLLYDNASTDEIVEVIIKYMSSRKYLREPLKHCIDSIPKIAQHFEIKRMKEIKYRFRPWVCLQQLDLRATVLFRAFDIICKIEFCQDENQRYRRGLLPSIFKLGKVCRQLKNYGTDILPFMLTGNSVKFDVTTAITFLLQKYGLGCGFENVRSKMVMLTATVDGSDLAWGLTQVSAGVKIVDSKTIDPLTGDKLFGESGHEKIQSRSQCYPLHIFIAKDNKELYQTHLSQFFREVNSFEDNYPNGILVAQGADMCSLQKTIGRGGAMKNKIYGCYCCDVYRDELCVPFTTPCSDCVWLQRTEPCYHRTVSDASWRARLTEDRDLLVQAYFHLLQMPFTERSVLRFTNNSIDKAAVDPLNIDFQPRNFRQKAQFRALLEKEYKLRGINYNSNNDVAMLKHELREILPTEKSYELVSDVLNECNDKQAMIHLKQALPCLLHL